MNQLVRLPAEFSLAQWIHRPKALARKRLICECWRDRHIGGHATYGFRCRGRGSCGRYCCACVGGSEPGTENLCAGCANERGRA
jgi:hypothetical protein